MRRGLRSSTGAPVALVTVCALLFAGCGSGDEETGSPALSGDQASAVSELTGQMALMTSCEAFFPTDAYEREIGDVPDLRYLPGPGNGVACEAGKVTIVRDPAFEGVQLQVNLAANEFVDTDYAALVEMGGSLGNARLGSVDGYECLFADGLVACAIARDTEANVMLSLPDGVGSDEETRIMQDLVGETIQRFVSAS